MFSYLNLSWARSSTTFLTCSRRKPCLPLPKPPRRRLA